MNPEKDKMKANFRVAIFGSARIKESDPLYNEVYQISKQLAVLGFDIVTGGGPGLMQAANSGHKSGNSDSLSIGLNIKLPYEQVANKFLDIKKEFERFGSRLDTFLSISDVIVVTPGGIGTLLELFYSWQLIQVRHVCETPIILYGKLWKGLLNWIQDEILSRQFINPVDMNNVFILSSCEKVVELIGKFNNDREKMEHICVNYEKYKVEWD